MTGNTNATVVRSMMTIGVPQGFPFHHGQAATRRVRPEGQGRGEPVGGCGTPAVWPGLSTPLWCGQRSRPWAGAGGPTRGALAALFAVVGRATLFGTSRGESHK